jgi:F0F1-type ATP synthase assembly protein I
MTSTNLKELEAIRERLAEEIKSHVQSKQEEEEEAPAPKAYKINSKPLLRADLSFEFINTSK